jgi:hypothetical protein
MILLISEKLCSPNTASNFSPIILTLACVSICCMNLSTQLPSSLHQTGKENMYAYWKQSISSPSKLPSPPSSNGKRKYVCLLETIYKLIIKYGNASHKRPNSITVLEAKEQFNITVPSITQSKTPSSHSPTCPWQKLKTNFPKSPHLYLILLHPQFLVFFA